VNVLQGALGIVEADGSTELPRNSAVTTGGYVLLNDDNDNYQFSGPTDMVGIKDNDQKKTGIDGEKDLVPLNIHAIQGPAIAGTAGHYRLTTSSTDISLWENSDKSVPIDATHALPAGEDIKVFVEGDKTSNNAAAEQVKLEWVSTDGSIVVPLDTVNYTVYAISGPANVLSGSKFPYTATVPGGGQTPAWEAGDFALDLPGGTPTTQRFIWGGPGVGKIYYAPAPGFRGEFRANIVDVTLVGSSESPPSGKAIIDTVRTTDDRGFSTAPDRISWTNTVQIDGPVVNGVTRGARFIDIGYIQELHVKQYNATYGNTTLTSSMEGGDYVDESTNPDGTLASAWPSQNSNSTTAYWSQISTATGTASKDMSYSDRPSSYVPRKNAGVDVTSFKIQMDFTTYLGAYTADPNVNPVDTAYFSVGSFAWSLDYSKNASGYIATNAITAHDWIGGNMDPINVPPAPVANTVSATMTWQ
jgi:hypothetical protein